MKILVCFTTAPDVEKLSGDDWLVENGLEIDVGFLKPALNSYDESALELALQLAQASRNGPNPFVLSALTIADRGAGPVLRTLNALPFDRIVRIANESDLRFAPRTVAAVLSQYVRRHARPDIVILGQQTSIGANAKTHLLLAEMLGWPCITRVVEMALADANQLHVISQGDHGRWRRRIEAPCVLAVGDAPTTFLRVPTLKDRMRLGRRPIVELPLDAFDLPQETEVLTNLEIIRHRRSAACLDGQRPEETAQQLFDEHLKRSLPLQTGPDWR